MKGLNGNPSDDEIEKAAKVLLTTASLRRLPGLIVKLIPFHVVPLVYYCLLTMESGAVPLV